MPASIGVNLRVTGNCRQGGRKYMEDFFSVAYQQTEDEKDLEYAFFGIYDGHGGAEAAAFAKEHLMETIIKHKNFWSDNDEDVLRAIKDGYIATHYAMWREQSKWPRTSSGLPSTAGTTSSVAFIRRGKIYIGHVGDSGIILGYQEPGSSEWRAKPLTKDHKPESPEEMKRIESCGGKVVAKSGVPRVVWNRPKIGHQGPVRRSTPIDEIPFLAVARSLGDLWSYNSQINQFVVSPDPDCSVLPIDTNIHRCLVFGTDGLFNMLSPSMAVHIVQQAERHNECAALSDSVNKVWLNPSKLLVERALDRWHTTKMRADNTSVVTLMLDPPGPPRAQVLKDRKKNLPESGLKIMTRYDGNSSQESSGDQSSCSRSVQTTETSETTSLDDVAKPSVPLETPENVPLPKTAEKDKIDETLNKDGEKCSASASSNVSISSSDVSSNYPLKERNFVPKLRESTSFDPREPIRLSDVGKENNTDKVEDNTIQIHEISSSNIEESGIEDDAKTEKGETSKVEVKDRCVLRSSLKKVAKIAESDDKKPSKRKLELDEGVHHQRKSLRLSLTQKFLDNCKKPAPCTLAEEKLKKLAEEAEKLKKLAESQNSEVKTKGDSENESSGNSKESGASKKLSMTQKILKSKKVNLKKKSLLRSQLTKKKLKIVLESVIPKMTKGQDQAVKKEVLDRKKTGKNQKMEKGPSKAKEKVAKTLEEKRVKSAEKSVKVEEKVPEKKKEKVEVKSEKSNTMGRLRSKKKAIVVPGKLSNFKRQSAKNTSIRPKGKTTPQTNVKPLKNVIATKSVVSNKPNNKADQTAGSSKSSKSSVKQSSKKEAPAPKTEKTSGSPRKTKLNDSQSVRETRSSLNNNETVRSSTRSSDAGKKLNTKEIAGRVTPKAVKNSSSIQKPPRSQSPKKSTLRQRIQDKTKTLRLTVLRKSS